MLKTQLATALAGVLFTIGASITLAANNTAATANTINPVNWQPCYTEENPKLLCARYAVPLNYQAKADALDARETISIALIKLPAQDSAQKPLGSLFVNPGGPSGSGVDFIRAVGSFLLTQDVRSRYDIISFDPRGINLSSPATCGLMAENAGEYFPSVDFPTNGIQTKERIKLNKRFGTLCAQNGNKIMQHMSTADVARDLDRLRQAVGDTQLNYVGYSYGSYLGVTYANLFPERVGRFLVDGVLDPIEWATGKGLSGRLVPMTQRLASDKGSMATLNEFLRLCDLAGSSTCSFAPNAAQRFAALANSIKQTPLILATEDGTEFSVDYPLFINTVKGSLYGVWNWQGLADLLVFTEAGAPAKVLGAHFSKLTAHLNEDEIAPTPFDNNSVGFFSVLCSDSNNPRDPWIWPLAAAVADLENGYFGASWSWPSSICTDWPANQLSRYSGPFSKHTRNTILVASTLFDPATPYSGAQKVRKLLPNSRLLTVAGWGHTTTGLSSCADAIIETYLLTGTAPEQDTTCNQEFLPLGIAGDVDVFADMPNILDVPSRRLGVKILKAFSSAEHKQKQRAVARALLRQNTLHRILK